MVSVVPVWSKSAATAPVPAADDTVMEVATLEMLDRVAVTVDDELLLSEIEAGVSTKVTVGASSSTMVPVPVMEVAPPANEAFDGLSSFTMTVSLPSRSLSSVIEMAGMVLLVSPAVKFRVPAVSAA